MGQTKAVAWQFPGCAHLALPVLLVLPTVLYFRGYKVPGEAGA